MLRSTVSLRRVVNTRVVDGYVYREDGHVLRRTNYDEFGE